MKQWRFYLFLILATLFIGCEEEEKGHLNVDSVSHATSDIAVTGGKAFATEAEIETYYKDSYNVHFFAYSLTNNAPEDDNLDTSFIYDDTLIRPNFPEAQVCSLSSLLPDTTYYYLLLGGIDTSLTVEHHFIKGSFRTAKEN